MKTYATFLSSVPADFLAPSGLEELAKFDAVELQIEFSQTKVNSRGEYFTPDHSTPFEWLRKRGVEVWGYYNPWHPPDWHVLGRSNDPPARNTYWLRREQGRLTDENNWYLYGHHYIRGEEVVHNSDAGFGYRPFPDSSNVDFLRWLTRALIDTGVKRIRFDDSYLTDRYAHFRPWRSNVPDSELNAGILGVFRALRSADIKVIANGAWEMVDPDANEWDYEAMDVVDGVMVELRVDGIQGGMSRANSEGWWRLSDDMFRRLARDWIDNGKIVIMKVRWSEHDKKFGDYDSFCKYYAALAKETGAWFAPSDRSYQSAAWLPWFERPEEIDEYEQELLEVLAQFKRLEARLDEVSKCLAQHERVLDYHNLRSQEFEKDE